MARAEDSAWAVSVAQVASRAGQSKEIDADYPAPSGIGDDIAGIAEGTPIHVTGSFDSIVDGLIFVGTMSAPFTSECTRCLKPITTTLSPTVTAFFPYDESDDKKDKRDKRGAEEVDIIAGEDESEDTYPLLDHGSFADLEALIRDTFVEALPMQPLCRPDCAGLCSQCGVDLNDEPDHVHETTDIRFAGLAALKEQLERHE